MEALTEEIRKQFAILACQLSPENLHCDGEISRAEAKRRERALLAKWSELERRVGRPVDEAEVWGL